jgi:alpha-glucosidase
MPFTGVSICGGYGKVDPELCARWMSLGSMYPFAMNYNADVDDNQEPYAFP